MFNNIANKQNTAALNQIKKRKSRTRARAVQQVWTAERICPLDGRRRCKKGRVSRAGRAVGPTGHWCVLGTPPAAPTTATTTARFPHRWTGEAASRPPWTRPRPGPVQAGRRSRPVRVFPSHRESRGPPWSSIVSRRCY